ncbi:MAG: response regulator [Bacillota bacterium]
MKQASARLSEVAASGKSGATPSEAQPPLRVLLAEDDDAARIALAYILQSVGFQVRQAKNGLEALAEAARGQDVILLDIQMPMLDGIRTLQGLRNNPDTANAAVIILTSHASRDCVLKCAQMGADGFVVKQTMELDVLVEKIHAAIQSRQARLASAAH